MKATIYTKENCVFCDRAKALAAEIKKSCENFDYELISREENNISLADLSEKAGKELTTSPQIWIEVNEKESHLGGFTDFEQYIRNAATTGLLIFK